MSGLRTEPDDMVYVIPDPCDLSAVFMQMGIIHIIDISIDDKIS